MSQAQEEKGVVSLPIHVAMVEHTLRDVSLGIVLTSLSVEVVTDAIQFGKTLRLEFLHQPDFASSVKVTPISADEFGVSMEFCRQVANFYSIRDLSIMSEGRGVFDFTATYRWQAWVGYMSRLADKQERDFRFHVCNSGRANFVEVSARSV